METPSKSRLHYCWVVLAMATFVVFASLGLARFGYTVVLPPMQTALGMDNTQAGVLATANLFGYLLLSAVGGALATRFGPRRIIAAGLLLAGVGMLLTGLVNSFALAAVFRAATGLGSGASNVPVIALLAAWFAARWRGLAAGIGVAGSSVAIIFLGPVVPRILLAYEQSGWRVCWFVFGGVTVLLAVTSYLLLRNRPAELGLSPFGETGAAPACSSGPEKIPWGRVYRSARVWHLGLVYAAFGFSYIIYMTFFVKGLMAEGGYSRDSAVGLFFLMGWCSLLCGLIWGTLSDRIGRKPALMLVYLSHAVSFSMFALWPSRAGFTVSAVLFGLSAWSIPAIMAAACGDVLGPKMAPSGLGFITLFFGIGQAVAPSVAGALADSTGSFRPPFLLAGAVALAGLIGSTFLKSVRPDEHLETV